MVKTAAARGPRVIVALDYPSPEPALEFVKRVAPPLCRLKVGLELYTAAGPAIVQTLVQRGFEVFLDLKYHDIPNTVAQACGRAAQLGVWMMNVHTLGGGRMLQAARAALDPSNQDGRQDRRPLLLGVTILTSHAPDDLAELGVGGTLPAAAENLAALAQRSGLDGVVCSPHEARALRVRFGPHFVLVTPGIRPSGVAADDQRRTMTPREAAATGADYFVIGRPVTRAADPRTVLEAVNEELAG